MKWLDQSPVLARLLESVSNAVTRQRGLPVLIGILCVLISFGVQTVNVFADNVALELIGVVMLHIGILMALIGLLIAEALGG
ncbi:MAG: hypothetical protein CL610_09655 [Anaerolineaceae bacterium]|nr:hypothetical protein [Anaerolineaceae bacterium]